jgi:hypothetical protein
MVEKEGQSLLITIAQYASLGFIWLFVFGISLWIVNLLVLSRELSDALEATIGISIVAIPVFLTLAGVLTYVFLGLRSEEKRSRDEKATS